MPAPKLLDKKTVNAELNQERRLQVEKGIELAKKVDALREILADEQEKLERFRTETVKKVQMEIDQLIKKRDNLLK
jgi:hypothetical protein